MANEIFKRVRNQAPYVHNITNYVTANDCANIILACGGRPIMADDTTEVEEITSGCNALVINIGTLNERTISSMLLAGRRANQLGIPVVLDPVGAGASELRTRTALQLLKEVRFRVIRGNASEIALLNGSSVKVKGVDVDEADAINDQGLEQALAMAVSLSKKTGAVIAITGETDIITDSVKAALIRNGHPMMSKVTGTGCMLTAILGTLCASNPDNPYLAAVTGVSAMGICGELAYERIVDCEEGTGAYRVYLMDAMSRMTDDILEGRSKIENVDLGKFNQI